jgi:hypothetical protein
LRASSEKLFMIFIHLPLSEEIHSLKVASSARKPPRPSRRSVSPSQLRRIPTQSRPARRHGKNMKLSK